MKPWEIILIVACAAIVVGVVVAAVVRKLKGKSGCDCDCASCGMCSHCAAKQVDVDTDKTTK